jgi:hypothetical protein
MASEFGDAASLPPPLDGAPLSPLEAALQRCRGRGGPPTASGRRCSAARPRAARRRKPAWQTDDSVFL